MDLLVRIQLDSETYFAILHNPLSIMEGVSKFEITQINPVLYSIFSWLVLKMIYLL